MDTVEQLIAIAKACGWTSIETRHFPGTMPSSSHGPIILFMGFHPITGTWEKIPDYINDLNAMHEAESWLMSQLNIDEWNKHVARLVKITSSYTPEKWQRIKTVGDAYAFAIHAKAADRAKAFLQTMKKWEDS